MIDKMSPEIWWLSVAVLMTALFWVPYTVQLIREMGVVDAFWDPYHETPIGAAWAQRAKRAHTNAIENLAVFAPLVLGVHAQGLGTAATASASVIYVLARAAHFCVYTLGIPLLRPLLFLVGFGCQTVLALTLLGAIP